MPLCLSVPSLLLCLSVCLSIMSDVTMLYSEIIIIAVTLKEEVERKTSELTTYSEATRLFCDVTLIFLSWEWEGFSSIKMFQNILNKSFKTYPRILNSFLGIKMPTTLYSIFVLNPIMDLVNWYLFEWQIKKIDE